MYRKDFLKALVAMAASGSLIAHLESCKKTDTSPSATSADFTLDLTQSSNSALNSNGGSVISNNVILINNNGSYVALSDICTHQGCSLSYSSSAHQLQCPCHGGTFSISGAVTGSPPSSSLKVYNVSQSGNVLHITG